jgi:hypothetical protein
MAMRKKLTIAARKLPSRIPPSPPGPAKRTIPEKSGCPKISPIIGMMMSLTSEVVIPANAAPIITPTARSIALPRLIKSLNL